MINKWMKNIRKYKLIIIAVIVFLVLFISLATSMRNNKSGAVQKGGFNIISSISNKFVSIRDSFSGSAKQKEIEQLKAENAKLKTQLIENTISKDNLKQLQALQKSLKFVTDKNSSAFVSADIVAKNSGNYYKTFTISAGSAQGVKTDSIVVNGEGLVGRVYEISKNYCKAISILDNRTPISFEIVGRNNDTGMIMQDTKVVQISDESLVKGYMFDSNSPVKVGEMITTSGLGLYPSGIPIGKIEQVIPDDKNILKYVVVRPFVDFTNLNKVMIFNKIDTES
ncbi:rod shape-determining protein MreC [[Eubacterium] yurii subsp. margaretiae ATCC 43715]|nr:rod shape-determining protein MreC [[Eubacterium] yurii subsp. margaretiae ATCC 43715]